MSRLLKRVPLDFNWPLNKVWEGYRISNAKATDFVKFPVHSCNECEKIHGKEKDFCLEEKTPYCVCYYPKWRKMWFEEIPKGLGFQLWENCTEGSPISPVFKTLDELCVYAEEHCTTFGNFKTTTEKWKKMLLDDNVYHQDGNLIFM